MSCDGHTHDARDVGAAPDRHEHDILDVSRAAREDHTHTARDLGGVPTLQLVRTLENRVAELEGDIRTLQEQFAELAARVQQAGPQERRHG